MAERTYLAVDLKSFYASVECVALGLDPLQTNLVVADKNRTEKTICLAVTPSLKKYGISGRARLFEVVQRVKEVNAQRRKMAPGGKLKGSSCNAAELSSSPSLALDYIIAPPRMAHYIEVSTQVYNIYLQYISPDDIFAYSVDEVFIDITDYLKPYGLAPRELAAKMLADVLEKTGITATAGIGTNLYLSKVAMDIGAKHAQPDANGCRIAELNEKTYRQTLWAHRPLTDFWRVGRGIADKLEKNGLYTMGDVARCSLGKEADYYNEALLYRLFGKNAELLIDHAWGWEPCRIADIKAYKPRENSLCSGQVLKSPYDFAKAKLVLREMAEALALDLVDKGFATNQLVLTVGYDAENLRQAANTPNYRGEITTDNYGRAIPKPAHGTVNLDGYTSSGKQIVNAVIGLYERIVRPDLLVRRMYLSANRLRSEAEASLQGVSEQLSLFQDYDELQKKRDVEQAELAREHKMQQTMLNIKKKFGKNAILKGMSLEDGATAIERNAQIGGHKE